MEGGLGALTACAPAPPWLYQQRDAKISGVTGTQVTVGGQEPGPPPPSPDPPKKWLAVGAIGVAVGLLFGLGLDGGTDPAVTEPGASPDIEPPPAVTITTVTTRPQADRLATRAPGFIDDLVVSYSTTVGTTGVSVWKASARGPVDAGLPAGEYLADSFHGWLATITSTRYSTGDILWVGNQAYMEPVGTGVIDAVWHTQRPGRITWTETGEPGVSILYTASFSAGQETIPVEVTRFEGSPGVSPVWWSTAGITVFVEDLGVLYLLDDASGETMAELAVDAFVAGTDVYAMTVRNGESWLVDGRLSPMRPLTISPSCLTGSFAGIGTPNGPFAALACGRADASQSLQVWSVGFDFEEMLIEVPGTGLVKPAWTPDGLMAILPTIDPVRPSTEMTFYSPGGDLAFQVDFPGRIFWLEVVTNR